MSLAYGAKLHKGFDKVLRYGYQPDINSFIISANMGKDTMGKGGACCNPK